MRALQNHHYAIALAEDGNAFPSAFPSVEIIDSNAVGVFNLTTATSPTDQAGAVGALVEAELVMDFYNQVVTNFDFGISFDDGRDVFAGINSPFVFSEGSKVESRPSK